MTAHTSKAGLVRSKLDTSYVSFETERGVRSPRTPTYVPESPSSRSARPFDHTKFFTDSSSQTQTRLSLPPPPAEKPMGWIWICHKCNSRYALGVTRRCLVDGHYYCSGESEKPSTRKRKKQKACSSEFDYAAWKQWGDWRRKVMRMVHNDRVFKSCKFCDFPSQCRYPVNAHPLGDVGVASIATEPKVTETTATVPEDAHDATTKSKSTANEKIDFDQILQSILSAAEMDDMDLDAALDTKQSKGGKKHERTDGNSALPSLKLSPDLRDLVKMEWANFEDIELGKTKVE